MRVLILTNLYPSASDPTRGVFNAHRLGALARHCDARVIAPLPCWTRRMRDWLEDRVESITGMDASFPTYYSIPGWSALHGDAMYRSLAPMLLRLRRSFAYDVILAAWAYPDAYAAARLSARTGCPLVTMVLGSDINDFARMPALAPKIRWTLRRSGRVVAVSHALRNRVVDLGVDPSRVIVQRNGVDGDRFVIRNRQEARGELGISLTRPLLCYVGNLKQEKGVEVLIEAMGRLSSDRAESPDLVMVGGGALEDALRSRVNDLGLTGRVRFAGRRPHEEIPTWIAASDALCLPSFREGCPNVVLEALASGRPVVATDAGGIPELVRPDAGRVVPPGDSERLACAIHDVMSRRWDEQALRGSVECLSWDRFGLTLRDVLASAMTEHADARAAGSRRGRRAANPVHVPVSGR